MKRLIALALLSVFILFNTFSNSVTQNNAYAWETAEPASTPQPVVFDERLMTLELRDSDRWKDNPRCWGRPDRLANRIHFRCLEQPTEFWLPQGIGYATNVASGPAYSPDELRHVSSVVEADFYFERPPRTDIVEPAPTPVPTNTAIPTPVNYDMELMFNEVDSSCYGGDGRQNFVMTRSVVVPLLENGRVTGFEYRLGLTVYCRLPDGITVDTPKGNGFRDTEPFSTGTFRFSRPPRNVVRPPVTPTPVNGLLPADPNSPLVKEAKAWCGGCTEWFKLIESNGFVNTSGLKYKGLIRDFFVTDGIEYNTPRGNGVTTAVTKLEGIDEASFRWRRGVRDPAVATATPTPVPTSTPAPPPTSTPVPPCSGPSCSVGGN